MSKVELFQQLFLGQEINGKLVDEDLLTKALNKCAGDKRLKNDVKKSVSNEEIIEQYVNTDDVLKALNSAANLQIKKPDTSKKLDDIRDMELSIDLLEGFRDAEKRVIQRRLSELAEDFNLEKSTDRFLAWRVAVCELKILQLETLQVCNPKEAESKQAQQQIDELDKQYKVFCESLNALKRQRDNTKDKTPKDTTVTDFIKTIKSLDEMQAEVKQKKLEIQLKKQEKQKRNK